MMKSFFKKLAFVMALAMVVTLAAPAAQASAAGEMGIALQSATSKSEVIASYTMKEKDTEDFKYFGAPKDYLKMSPTWSSSNEGVATVDKYGVVTAHNAGTAVITITLSNGYTGSIVIFVEKAVDPNAFEAKQKSHITFDVNFNKEVSYGRNDVHLYRVFNTDKGDVYVVWAVQKATLSADKKTLTVEPYVQFNDGERYLVAFQDIEAKLNSGSSLDGIHYDEFITSFGEIDKVEVSYYSTVDKAKKYGKAYTNGEDAEEDIEVTLDCKLFSGEVELTSIYKDSKGYVEYVLTNEDEVLADGNTIGDFVTLSDNTLVFTKAGIPAKVIAKFVFETADGEEKVTPSAPATIISEQLPKFAIDYVQEWSFTNDGDWKWANPDHAVRAGKLSGENENGVGIALLLVDNRGNKWEYGADKDANIPQFGANDTDTEDMYLRFHSTDNDRFLVDADGFVKTYIKTKKAVVYVALHDINLLEEHDSDFVRNIYGCVMEIQEEAKFNGVAVYEGNNTKNSVTLVTNAVVDPANTDRFVDEFTKKSYTIKSLDQDKAVYNPANDNVLANTDIEYTLTTTNKDIKEAMEDVDSKTGVYGLEINGNSLDIDAVALNELTNSSTITATITATQYGEDGKAIKAEKTTFKVSLRDPELFDDDDTVFPGVWTIGDVEPTSWSVSVDNVGLMTKTERSTAKIKLTMLSKSYTVGYYNRYDMSVPGEGGEGIYVVEDAKAYKFGAGEGKINTPGIYVLVTDKDGKAVKSATSSSMSASSSALGLGVYVDEDQYFVGVNVTADDDGDGYVDYLATGKYTVKVTFVNADGSSKTRTDYFTVTDDMDHVRFVDMYEVESALTVDNANDLDDIKQVIIENYKFEYDIPNKGEWKTYVPKASNIKDVNCIVKGDYITIISITFQIEAGSDYYITTTKNINRAVKLGVEK